MRKSLLLSLALLPSAAVFASSPIVIDSQGSASSTYHDTGSGAWVGESSANAVNGDQRYSNASDATAYYTFSNLAAGNYVAYATYSINQNRTTSATYTINGGGAVTINQVQAGNWLSPKDTTATSRIIQTALINQAASVGASGSVTVAVQNTGSGYLIADSVTLEKARNDVKSVHLVYPQSAGNWGPNSFTKTSGWNTYGDASITHTLGGISGYYYGGPGESANYTFGGLEDGYYRLSACWTPSSNRPEGALYMINGTVVGTADQRVNLTSGNSDDYFAGVYWKDVASNILIQGGQVTINLSTNEVGKLAIADGLRLEFTQAIPEPSTYVFTGVAAALGMAFMVRRRRNK